MPWDVLKTSCMHCPASLLANSGSKRSFVFHCFPDFLHQDCSETKDQDPVIPGAAMLYRLDNTSKSRYIRRLVSNSFNMGDVIPKLQKDAFSGLAFFL
jgi:hypothetical protein